MRYELLLRVYVPAMQDGEILRQKAWIALSRHLASLHTGRQSDVTPAYTW
jgi:hypothetical protein